MDKLNKSACVIGAGFSGLAAACTLAAKGYEVRIHEKNADSGGRARKFTANGFTFDMGPSWYWMPDVFESFFNHFGKSSSDYYNLVRLDPSYSIFFSDDEIVQLPSTLQDLYGLFERLEAGSSEKLKLFLKEAEVKYTVGMKEMVYQPSLSPFEFVSLELFKNFSKLHLFGSFSSYIRKFFKNEKILKILEFPVLFLGAMPQEIPSLYSLMNYADLKLGTWYPMGGMHKIIEGMEKLATELGVEIIYDSPVTAIITEEKRIWGIKTGHNFIKSDILIASADYQYIDSTLLKDKHSNYTKPYWESRTLSPSALVFYIGVNKRIKKLQHHNLFFDENLDTHSTEIYKDPKWPTKPLFYVCCPSKTDSTVAPDGCENLFILMPIAPGLEDSEEMREKYFNILMKRLEKASGQNITEHIVYKRSYCINDFVKDYNAFKGNAYGLANTLRQTAFLKPSIKNKKLQNLYYTGQMTVPGPGVPPSIISGMVVANLADRENR